MPLQTSNAYRQVVQIVEVKQLNIQKLTKECIRYRSDDHGRRSVNLLFDFILMKRFLAKSCSVEWRGRPATNSGRSFLSFVDGSALYLTRRRNVYTITHPVCRFDNAFTGGEDLVIFSEQRECTMLVNLRDITQICPWIFMRYISTIKFRECTRVCICDLVGQ
jgi:hypothetical protein